VQLASSNRGGFLSFLGFASSRMAMKIMRRTMEDKMKNGRTLYPDSARIEILVEKNSGRRGTKSHETFEIARRSPTIGDYRDAGGKLEYLRWHRGAGSWRLSSSSNPGPESCARPSECLF
jgi:hypothetical protein